MIYRLILIFIFSFSSLYAEDGTIVMEKAYDEMNFFRNKTIDIQLTIIDSDNNQRVSFFTLRHKKTDNINKTLMKFYEPVKVKGTGLLTYKDIKKNTIMQWVYFPSFKAVRALSSDEKNQSFLGSDFSYSDIAGREVYQDSHEIIKEDDKYYYIISTPYDQKDPYSRIDIILSKKNNIPVKISFFNKEGKLLKTLVNETISEIYGRSEIIQATMFNQITGGKSTIYKNKIDVSTSLSDDDVSLKMLQN
jgi:hypothetical protein